MSWFILIVPSAEKEIAHLPNYLIQRIRENISILKTNPYPPNSKKLKGDEGWRLRAGDYRIVYDVDKKLKRVIIRIVRHRKDVYR